MPTTPQHSNTPVWQPTKTDERMMRRCFSLALNGSGKVAPNPLVGALITNKGRIIGQGFHQYFGGPHAEVCAVEAVAQKEILRSSRLYVSLEPCCHFGKTPPCTELILKHGIPEVVVACLDPFREVAGRGIEQLRSAGVKVHVGVLESEAAELNRRFFLFHRKKRPYIILKWAETKDGFIAREDHTSKWISSEASRKLVHKWRSEESAIMIGTNTALNDNPYLTVRRVQGSNPIRVVLDRSLRLPLDLHLFDGSVKTLVFNEQKQEKRAENLEYEKVPFDESILESVLASLHKHQVLSCIVEGGAQLLNSFMKRNLWDEARVFVSPRTFGMGLKGPLMQRTDFQKSRVGPDELRIFRNR